MGYDLHVTRAIDWAANVGHEIPAGEWLALVVADAELVADPAHGRCAVRYGQASWFDWFEGNVFTTDPDRAAVAKLLTIASKLDSILQGDDGEIYERAQQWPRPAPDARGN